MHRPVVSNISEKVKACSSVWGLFNVSAFSCVCCSRLSYLKSKVGTVVPSRRTVQMAEENNHILRLAEKLWALEYPYEFDEKMTKERLQSSFDGSAKGDDVTAWCMCRDPIIFLEDVLIRSRAADDRKPLRTSSPRDFLRALRDYFEEASALNRRSLFPMLGLSSNKNLLKRLDECVAADPVSKDSADVAVACVLLLCDVATRLRTKDLTPEAVKEAHKQWQNDHSRRLVTSVEVLQDVDTTKKKQGSREEEEKKIAWLLKPIYDKRGISMPTNVYTALQETSQFVKAIKGLQNAPKAASEADTLLDTVPLFSGARTTTTGGKGDASQQEFEKAVKVLRLLFMLDLRELQDSINNAIGEMQNHTATCKIDPRLGRVGR